MYKGNLSFPLCTYNTSRLKIRWKARAGMSVMLLLVRSLQQSNEWYNEYKRLYQYILLNILLK